MTWTRSITVDEAAQLMGLTRRQVSVVGHSAGARQHKTIEAVVASDAEKSAAPLRTLESLHSLAADGGVARRHGQNRGREKHYG